MGTYIKRVQTVLTEDQFTTLTRLSETTGKPLSVLIREAVEEVYFEQAQREQRQQALETLLALNAPVDEWDVMEEQIIQGSSA